MGQCMTVQLIGKGPGTDHVEKQDRGSRRGGGGWRQHREIFRCEVTPECDSKDSRGSPGL